MNQLAGASNRRAILPMTPALLHQLLMLPPEFAIVDASKEAHGDRIGLVIESQLFPEVAEGISYPRVNLSWTNPDKSLKKSHVQLTLFDASTLRGTIEITAKRVTE